MMKISVCQSVSNPARTTAAIGASRTESRETAARDARSVADLDLIAHTERILLNAGDASFSTSINDWLERTPATRGVDDIPKAVTASAIKLARCLLNEYIAKQASHRHPDYAGERDHWDEFAKRIHFVGAKKGHATIRDLLSLAGIRVDSTGVQSRFERTTAEDPASDSPYSLRQPLSIRNEHDASHGFASRPPPILATDCLYAYLSNDESCVDALNSYTPSMTSIDAAFVRDVAALAQIAATQYRRNATARLAGVRGKRPDDVIRYSATAKKTVFSGDTSRGPVGDASARSELSASDGDDFPAHNASARAAMVEATASCQQAERLADLSQTIGALLMTDPDRENDAPLGVALASLLKSLPGNDRLTSITSMLEAASVNTRYVTASARFSSRSQEWPVQNILGTYVEKYGWQDLQALLLSAVASNAQHIEKTAADVAAQAQTVRCTTNRETRPAASGASHATTMRDCLNREHGQNPPWIQRTMPMVAIKLLLARLRRYIERDDFKRLEQMEYRALATLLHDNQTLLASDMSLSNVIRDRSPAMLRIAGAQVAY